MQTRSCKWCNGEFPPNKHHRKFCSPDCYAHHRKEEADRRNAADLKRRKDKIIDRPCSVCGKPFRSPYSTQITCSHDCKRQHDLAQVKLRRGSHNKVCANCGEEFSTRKPNGKYCSKACHRAHRMIQAVPRTCPCGNVFESTGTKKFCSQECRDKYGLPSLRLRRPPRVYKESGKKPDRNTYTTRVLDKSRAGVYYTESEFWSELTKYRKNLDHNEKREDDNGYKTAIDTYWQFHADSGQAADRGGERPLHLEG